eukprot:m.126374 g.126374  ORF g.126374 m.126374 type:complete len:235 (-) comp13568_c2_seq2:129-833(-)
MSGADSVLEEIAAATATEFHVGPQKKSERLFEKARIAYDGDLRRVTDYERRSFVCGTFAEAATVTKRIGDGFEVLRMKKRFSAKNRSAKDRLKESGGYHDLQFVVRVPETDLLLEVQVHLAVFYDVKTSLATTQDADGRSGHERYVEFRGIQEEAEYIRRNAKVTGDDIELENNSEQGTDDSVRLIMVENEDTEPPAPPPTRMSSAENGGGGLWQSMLFASVYEDDDVCLDTAV